MPNTYVRLILIIEYGTLAFGQYGHLFREINACYKEHKQLLTRVEALERSTVQLQNEIQLKTNPEPVAFQAHLSVDHALYPTSATIKFDDVVLNSGSGYNPSTGKFTCPSDGFYSFTWTITTRARKVCHTMFMIDSQPVMRGYLDLKKSTNSFAATKSVVAEMKNGSEAWIEVKHSCTYATGAHTGLTMFNGFKI